MAAYQTAQKLQQWYYGTTNPGAPPQYSSNNTAQNNAYQYGTDPYSWYTNSGAQNSNQQVYANPEYSGQQYSGAQYAANPQNNRYMEQGSNGQSANMVANGAGAYTQSQDAPAATGSDGVAYMQAYDREPPQRNDLLTRYRMTHHGAPGGKLRNTSNSFPISRVFGSNWW